MTNPVSVEIPPAPEWFRRKVTRAYLSAMKAAELLDVDPDAVVDLMPQAYSLMMADRDMTQPGRQRACQLTRLNARRCNQWEDAGKDHSTYPRFDTAARTVAIEHPELGLDPDDTDSPGRVWEIIKAGAAPRILKTGMEVAMFAAEMVDHVTVRSDAAEPEDDGYTGFDPSEFDTPVTAEIVTVPGAVESVTYEPFTARQACVRPLVYVSHADQPVRRQRMRGYPGPLTLLTMRSNATIRAMAHAISRRGSDARAGPRYTPLRGNQLTKPP